MDQTWTEAAHPKVSSTPEPAALESLRSQAPAGDSSNAASASSSSSSSSDGGAEAGAASVVAVEGPAHDPGLHSLAGQEMLWGELYAREQRTGLRQLLRIPARRQDAALHLIAQVRLAVPTPNIDC